MEKTIQKASKISHDGRNLMTRIPKAIEEEADLKKGDALLWEARGKKLGITNMGSHEAFMKKLKKQMDENEKIQNKTHDALSEDALNVKGVVE